jgi:hypothetical protein
VESHGIAWMLGLGRGPLSTAANCPPTTGSQWNET